jgi:hypothetical protein
MTETKCIFCDDKSVEATLTWDGEIGYKGRVSGHDRWNGFAIPAFTRQVVEDMIFDTTGAEGCDQLRFLSDGTLLHTYGDGDGFEIVEPSACCQTYPVGAWAWTWVEMEDLCECGHYIDNHDVREATPTCPACDCGK